eukprot:9482726-Pyramimonas_sp.AAC.1
MLSQRPRCVDRALTCSLALHSGGKGPTARLLGRKRPPLRSLTRVRRAGVSASPARRCCAHKVPPAAPPALALVGA